MQRKMLTIKKMRLERLIAGIDKILKGENDINFEIFNKSDLEELYHSIVSNMNKEQKALFVEQYGSLENFQKHFLENVSDEEVQKNFQKLAAKKDCDVHSFEVKELIGEYNFVSKQLYQMKDVSKMSLELADLYLTDSNMQKAQDAVYGKGATSFFGKAIQAFYAG